jgi:uncharacterized protein YukE
VNIAFVGAGKACLLLMDFFSSLEDVYIVGVADVRADAPGILYAQKKGIQTTDKMDLLIERPEVQLVIELTGSAKVKAAIMNQLRPDQEIITASGAKLVCDMIEAQAKNKAAAAQAISQQFNGSSTQLQVAIEGINSAHIEVEKLLREARMVSLNARIEAARAGKLGDAFGVVVDRIHEMLGSVANALNKIASASNENQITLKNLKNAESRLVEEFRRSK